MYQVNPTQKKVDAKNDCQYLDSVCHMSLRYAQIPYLIQILYVRAIAVCSVPSNDSCSVGLHVAVLNAKGT